MSSLEKMRINWFVMGKYVVDIKIKISKFKMNMLLNTGHKGQK